MTIEKSKPFAHAMAFCHQDGLPVAWKQALRFADIITARLQTKPGDLSWENYFTTLTGEYYGLSQRGNPILIIAHGVGPLATLDGVLDAYGWEFKDKSRSRTGGRITQANLRDLEAGKFGAVEVVDYKAYVRRYKYPFIQTLRFSEALTDPVVKARFGPQSEQYLLAHANYACAWHRERAGQTANRYGLPHHSEFVSRHWARHFADNLNPFIIQVAGAANCSYFGRDYRFGGAVSLCPNQSQ